MNRLIVLTIAVVYATAFGYTLQITTDAAADAKVSSTEIPGTLPASADEGLQLMPNWPQRVGVGSMYRPVGVTLADLNGDDTLEIIAGGTDNVLHVWNYHGNELAGWPQTLSGAIQSKVAVGDIYGDGQMFLVCATRDGNVHIRKTDGGSLSGWPRNAGGTGGLVSPTLFDLDGNDTLEIIAVQYPPGTVYVWRHDGTVYPGWPKTTDYLAVATASVGDVDADGVVEICVPSYRSLYLWDKDGNTEPGWPVNLGDGASYAQPELYDIDHDGRLEIAHVCYPNRGNGRVYLFRWDGSLCPGFPVEMPNTPQPYVCAAAGEMNDDTNRLSLYSGGHLLNAPAFWGWYQDGSVMPNWPLHPSMLECSPVIFGIDGGIMGVMVASNTTPGQLYAYYEDGTPVEGFPVITPDAALPNSPAIGDVDCDGEYEVALTTMDGSVSLWTSRTFVRRPILIDWGCWFHDNWHTGWLHPAKPEGVVAERGNPGVRLTWRKNSESDIKGYFVYRLAETGRFERLFSRPIAETTYLDTTAIGDTTRYYYVTAVIRAGKEGRQSTVVALNPSGIEEENIHTSSPTTARNILHLPALPPDYSLFDPSGRRVMKLHPGTNSIRHLAPGIYFAIGRGRPSRSVVVVK